MTGKDIDCNFISPMIDWPKTRIALKMLRLHQTLYLYWIYTTDLSSRMLHRRRRAKKVVSGTWEAVTRTWQALMFSTLLITRIKWMLRRARYFNSFHLIKIIKELLSFTLNLIDQSENYQQTIVFTHEKIPVWLNSKLWITRYFSEYILAVLFVGVFLSIFIWLSKGNTLGA